ncbi:MAG: GGDEF domain-containing protein [Brevundimonas sp.]|uniref:GGDEF domain-containing protein n=1 Tax=Brevundimonas sp. TaxID=1871086 RepID=UPI00391BE9BF
MTGEVETTLRGPEAFSLARQALEAMEAAGVWPTPLNFELWLHYLGNPEGPLGLEMKRLMDAGTPFTEDLSEMLMSEFLPRGRLSDEIRDAGLMLNRELTNVAEVIASARSSQAEYGQTLAHAGASMEAPLAPEEIKRLVGDLTTATSKVHLENATLEKRLEASTREVAQLRQHLEQVRRDAMTDALTNLANRKAFDEQLDRACEEAGKAPLTLAVLDIDHFKKFNDTWGHQTGDQVLRYVASVLGRTLRSPRIAARYGGEEFTLLFPGETARMAETVLNTIREEIASRSLRRRSTNDDLGAVTVSIGLAQKLPGDTAVDLMGRADEALYASKHAGRNRVTCAARLSSADKAA